MAERMASLIPAQNSVLKAFIFWKFQNANADLQVYIDLLIHIEENADVSKLNLV
jgi:hypothetical protein